MENAVVRKRSRPAQQRAIGENIFSKNHTQLNADPFATPLAPDRCSQPTCILLLHPLAGESSIDNQTLPPTCVPIFPLRGFGFPVLWERLVEGGMRMAPMHQAMLRGSSYGVPIYLASLMCSKTIQTAKPYTNKSSTTNLLFFMAAMNNGPDLLFGIDLGMSCK